MKSKNKVFFASVLIVISTIIFTACEKNIFKKDVQEVISEGKWKITEWTITPSILGYGDFTDLYELHMSEECREKSFYEFNKNDTVYYHYMCEDTVYSDKQWRIEDDVLYLEWANFIYNSGTYIDTATIWQIEDYSKKEINLKYEYTQYTEAGEGYDFTETKTLSLVK